MWNSGSPVSLRGECGTQEVRNTETTPGETVELRRSGTDIILLGMWNSGNQVDEKSIWNSGNQARVGSSRSGRRDTIWRRPARTNPLNREGHCAKVQDQAVTDFSSLPVFHASTLLSPSIRSLNLNIDCYSIPRFLSFTFPWANRRP